MNNRPQAALPVMARAPLVAAAAFFLISCVIAGIQAGTNSIAKQSQNLLIARADPEDRSCASQLPDFRMALSLDPLNASVVNGYVYCTISAARSEPATAVANAGETALSLVGWRNTTVLQNRLTLATRTKNVALILNLVDALLRRNQLDDQLIPMMNALEETRAGREIVADKIAAKPPWVDRYLSDVRGLTSEAAISGRALLLKELIAREFVLTETVLIPSLERLVARGYIKPAAQLWRLNSNTQVYSGLIQDPNFVRFSNFAATEQLRSPFDWYSIPQAGLSVVTVPGKSRYIEVSWDRKGQPVFLAQQTDGVAGAYAVDITAEAPLSGPILSINVGAKCANGTASEKKLIKRRGATSSITLGAVLTASCDNFVLEIKAPAETSDTTAVSILPLMGNERRKVHIKSVKLRKIEAS